MKSFFKTFYTHNYNFFLFVLFYFKTLAISYEPIFIFTYDKYSMKTNGIKLCFSQSCRFLEMQQITFFVHQRNFNTIHTVLRGTTRKRRTFRNQNVFVVTLSPNDKVRRYEAALPPTPPTNNCIPQGEKKCFSGSSFLKNF